jgi:hypothetical protein
MLPLCLPLYDLVTECLCWSRLRQLIKCVFTHGFVDIATLALHQNSFGFKVHLCRMRMVIDQ